MLTSDRFETTINCDSDSSKLYTLRNSMPNPLTFALLEKHISHKRNELRKDTHRHSLFLGTEHCVIKRSNKLEYYAALLDPRLKEHTEPLQSKETSCILAYFGRLCQTQTEKALSLSHCNWYMLFFQESKEALWVVHIQPKGTIEESKLCRRFADVEERCTPVTRNSEAREATNFFASAQPLISLAIT